MSDFIDLAKMPARDARRSLIYEWHEMNEAGCCDEDGPFCDASKSFAQGYLYAIAQAESAGFDLSKMHTCAGRPTDRCDACVATRKLVRAEAGL